MAEEIAIDVDLTIRYSDNGEVEIEQLNLGVDRMILLVPEYDAENGLLEFLKIDCTDFTDENELADFLEGAAELVRQGQTEDPVRAPQESYEVDVELTMRYSANEEVEIEQVNLGVDRMALIIPEYAENGYITNLSLDCTDFFDEADLALFFDEAALLVRYGATE